MPLNNYQYEYKGNDAIIVSRDKGSSRQHIGENNAGCTIIRYRIDGVIIRQKEACDFLLTNEDKGKAYLIELKGCRVADAAKQLMATENDLHDALKQYSKLYFRIVASKCTTHQLEDIAVKKLIKKWGRKYVRIKTGEIKEEI